MEATQTLIPYDDKTKFYAELSREIEALKDPIWFTALANASASLKQHLPDINWVGFYLMKGGELVLGPFQGLPACTRIAVGRGVCGTAVRERKSMLIEDVDQFPGHIACDSASRSEVVIPLFRDFARTDLIGVLDVDSPTLSRFDAQDLAGLELIASTLTRVNAFADLNTFA
ncbi:MAG: GAF domain-containing protein [Proteobacteria bacterium]|nr:MAG: GAF domain-containing protein [Pseudomonadota bacterium]